MDGVILNYNSSSDTVELLSNLLRMNDIFEHIVVVDNNSNEKDKAALSAAVDEMENQSNSSVDIKLIFNKKNTGYASGNNIGLKYLNTLSSRDNLVAIMNPDIYIEEQQLRGVIKNYQYFESKSGENSVGVISPWVINTGQAGMVAWKLPYFWSDVIASSMILKKLVGDKLEYKKLNRNKHLQPVDVLPGSFLIINKTALEIVGFLEENTFLYCEERILASKMKRNGFKTLLDTDHYYHHAHSKTINKFLNGLKKIDFLYDSKRVYYKQEKKSYIQSFIISNLRFLSKAEYVCIQGLKSLIAIKKV
ncbi:glycosyltransferase family 2 protein [Priestia megaterium]|uniref:glycosyltransferase family 2 protein n=1 Tax=Priestia aryabhattai TaxID=412384 RepID=UPI0027E4F89E|nr:glycosyltransferase family 2 protein [Priestia aryabhattai]MCG0045542.1 glycosyltransferase family 2 protein [Priestia aryabhattai]